jgi:hypothetical protein
MDPRVTADEIAATPRQDEGLERLALSLDADRIVASTDTYERVVADVAAIRALAPSLADIDYRGFDDAKQLLVNMDDEGNALLEAGQYAAWDCLNEFYGLQQAEITVLDGIDVTYATLTLKGLYNLGLVAEAYEQLPNVTSVGANVFVGDGPTMCAARAGEVYEYVVDRRGGDCPAGCTTHDATYFVSSASGVVDEVETWDEGTAPEWFTRLCQLGPL